MADVGTGTTITFGTSGFTAAIMSVNGESASREAIKTSHMGTTTSHTFMPSDLVDEGGVGIDIQFDPDEQPPINGAAETVTVTFPVPSGLSNGATAVGTGFITDWTWTSPLEEMMTATCTLKWSGAVVWSDAT